MGLVEPFQIAVSVGADRARVFCEGELDLASAPVLQQRVEELLGNGSCPALIVLDVGRVSFCDSAGINAFIRITEEANRVGTTIQIANVTDNVARVFDLTHANAFLNVTD